MRTTIDIDDPILEARRSSSGSPKSMGARVDLTDKHAMLDAMDL
jgi:hypothetical protein